ncbi:MAG: tetratricopeptide repeat protein [Treponema sp.]|jgi:tetratricopeptide (TPR) repeat protein|nr:tetratricopeptide repeat protein [Treponema sp.]
MHSNKPWSRYGRHIYRFNRILAVTAALIVILAVSVSLFLATSFKSGVKNEKRDLQRVWNAGNYEQAYVISKNALADKPIDYFLLTTNGFSAYQLGISQINNNNTLFFIDECIRSLRKTLLLKESANDGRVYYVLGKAYSYKGMEYADLVIKYLEKANSLSYGASDIPEYLGLAYAACSDYRSSVEAFSRSFIPGKQPSDTLLLSIARSYMAMEEYSMAAGYLKQCIDSSPDSKSVIVALLLLAEIYKTTNDFVNAEKMYVSILDASGENAEVHYQLGELYNLQGDTTKARAEWRIAYRQNPAHSKARARLNI